MIRRRMQEGTLKLAVEDLEDLARGAALLGTGGGGDPYIGRLLAKHAIEQFGMPDIVEPASLDTDATVLPVAMLGAPTVLMEKGACGDEVDLVLERMEQSIDRKADALMPIEIGGVNSMVPIMAAARRNLPLVNADGMGRAFPEVQMVSFTAAGVSCTPLVAADEHLNSLVIHTKDPKRAEELVRVAAVEMGAHVVISCYPLTGQQVRQHAVPGSLTAALDIGRAIRCGRQRGDPVNYLVEHLHKTFRFGACRRIFDGKVVDLRRETRGGFSVGHCHVAGSSGTTLVVTFRNEHLAARESGELRAVVPDLICLVDAETADPLPVETLKYGQRVTVLGLGAAPAMRTTEALQVFGPEAFGLKDVFVPIEKLNPSTDA